MKPLSIQLKSILWLGAMALLLPVTRAHAAITCGISSPGFVTGYDAAAVAININQTYFTVTCIRTLAADPASVNYSAAVDDGLQPLGKKNRAAFGANRIFYDTWKDATCVTPWKSATPIAGTITFGTTIGPLSTQTAFWGCIPATQAGLPAGTYTDTVTMTLSYGSLVPQATASGPFPVSITPPSDCKITTAPGNIVFTYTAFGIAQAASTTFATTCTNLLPYTMALDATSGVVSGLQYSLTVAASSTGTGLLQTFSINGTMPAGQAGTCAIASCAGSQLHTLTITY